jgi:hypothetical protein
MLLMQRKINDDLFIFSFFVVLYTLNPGQLRIPGISGFEFSFRLGVLFSLLHNNESLSFSPEHPAL